MKKFMDKDFLLNSELAVQLYEATKNLPIIDYHCHLDPKEIAENKHFRNITEIWLAADHYKWRFMRTCGVAEEYITGNASDYEKFEKWSEVIEDAIGSPLYHWTHLELQKYFDYSGTLSKKNAKEVWEHCNKIIQGDDFNVWKIFESSNVEALCTTDDPLDSLSHHLAIQKSGIATKVLPTFRPSIIMEVADSGFVSYVKRLEQASEITIGTFVDLLDALRNRVLFFNSVGCKLSDHALEPLTFQTATADELEKIFSKAMNREILTKDECDKYRTATFIALGKQYHELNWTMQLHIGALRNNNTRMYLSAGANIGFDSISDEAFMITLGKLLDSLDQENKLPKTILYTLNPSADDAIATMVGNFQGGGVKGKIQFGSAWWFSDTKTGMQKQMITLANLGSLARFVGMLTDSRSFLSYTRHDYFRRIMISVIADLVMNGEYPNDMEKLSQIVSNISYYNAKEYFSF